MTSTRSIPLAPAIARTCSVCGVRPDCESRCGSAARRTDPIAILRSLAVAGNFALRSEERRVGKECRCRWSPDHLKKKDIYIPYVWLAPAVWPRFNLFPNCPDDA